MNKRDVVQIVKTFIPRPWRPRIRRLLSVVFPGLRINTIQEYYQLWRDNHTVTSFELNEKKVKIVRFRLQPKISIITPVFNTKKKYLEAALRSIEEQIYGNWELCIVDDYSTAPHIRTVLDNFARRDGRVRVSYSTSNQQIARASNRAIQVATGEYLFFVDHDDTLEPDALFEIVSTINQRPDVKLIYFDEDRPSGDKVDTFVDCFFKPDWSPDLLRSTMYIPHCVVRADCVREVGGFREEFPIIAHDYDLVLRLTERMVEANIFHIPEVLYHWRDHGEAVSSRPGIISRTNEAAMRALKDHLSRTNTPGSVELGIFQNYWRVKYGINGTPLVSIIVPTKNAHHYLSRCINSVIERTTYKNYEIIVIDNGSDDPETLSYLEDLRTTNRVRVLSYPHPFNYSAINNFAAREARGEFLIFLNVDTRVISGEWLTALLEHAQRKEVGAVGAKLLYPNGTIQHAGVVMGWSRNGIAGHAFAGEPSMSPGYHGFTNCIRNVSAVTAACMMVRKQLFLSLGGFDEKHLGVIFNDVDFCLRTRQAGYLIVYTPYAILYHHESAVRGYHTNSQPEAIRYMLGQWGTGIRKDPFYNKNLSLDRLYDLSSVHPGLDKEDPLTLSSDLFIRNSIIGRLIAAQRQQVPTSILDIGGYNGRLGSFLSSNDEYTILDVFDIRESHYMKGDVCNLSLPDKSYDIVVASDMYEHLKAEDRERAFLEMVRVARQCVILGAPFRRTTSADAERMFNDTFRSITGKNHPWLSEHIQNGLPDAAEFERIIQREKLHCVKIGTGNVDNWFLLQCMIVYCEVHCIPDYKRVIRFYNTHYKEIGDFDEPVNRSIYLISRNPLSRNRQVAEALEEFKPAPVNHAAYFEFLRLFFTTLDKNYRGKISNALLLKRMIKKALRKV